MTQENWGKWLRSLAESVEAGNVEMLEANMRAEVIQVRPAPGDEWQKNRQGPHRSLYLEWIVTDVEPAKAGEISNW